jgi:hypothetical protein
VSAAAVEVFDVEFDVEAEEVDDCVPLDVAAVAAQPLESDVVAVVAVVAALLFFVAVLFADVTAVAALPVACTAMAPLKPSSAATLAPAAAFRARRAGCGRFRRGFVSGISRSFVGGGRIVVMTLSMWRPSSGPEVRDAEEAARTAGKKLLRASYFVLAWAP